MGLNFIVFFWILLFLSAPAAGIASMENPSTAGAAENIRPAETGLNRKIPSTADGEDLKFTLKTLAGNIRKSPSLEAEVIEILYRGDIVSVNDRKGEWLAVRLQDGKTGWAHRSLFSPTEPDIFQTGGAQHLLKKIRIVVYSENEERVLIDLSGFSSPDVFTAPGNRPALICDFPETRCTDGVALPETKEEGFIRQVAVRRKGSGTRVVVSLAGSHDYDIRQVFFSAESVYALIFKKR